MRFDVLLLNNNLLQIHSRFNKVLQLHEVLCMKINALKFKTVCNQQQARRKLVSCVWRVGVLVCC